MANQWNPDSVFEVLADPTARELLAAVNVSPRSAEELTQLSEGSQSAVYRRLNVLEEYDLVIAETKLHPEGDHYEVFEPDGGELAVELDGAEIVVDVDGAEYDEGWPNVREIN